MSSRIVNLTLPLVITAIERVLEAFPHHPYQQAFANPDLRQQLVAYVLTQIHNLYAVDLDQTPPAAVPSANVSLTERLHLEGIIRQGVYHILQENSTWISQHLPVPASSGLEPSHWFG